MKRHWIARVLFACLVTLLLTVIGFNVYRRNHGRIATPAIDQLSTAVQFDDITAIDRLLKRGVNVNEITRGHPSVLSIALSYNRFEAVKMLIEHGADIKSGGPYDGPPLIRAALTCPQAVPLLIEKGADVNTVDSQGETPLLAALKSQREKELVPLLLAHGARLDAKTKFGETVLMRAVAARDMPLVKILLRRGADVNSATAYGATTLNYSRTPEMATLLISHGAKVDVRDKFGYTPLMAAWNSRVARVLLAHGAQVNARTTAGQTALMLTENPKVIRALLEYKADPNLKDNKRHTALFYALGRNDIPSALDLVDGGAETKERMPNGQTMLQTAIYIGNADLVKAMLRRGVDLTQKGDFNGTPLQTAIRRKRPDIVLLLKQAGAKE